MKARTQQQPGWFIEVEDGSLTPFGRGGPPWQSWPLGWSHKAPSTATWTPAVDMFDKGDQIVVRIDLPGVPREAIDISLEKDILTVRGERPTEEEIKGDAWLCCERSMGAFYRAIQLPAEVANDQVTAEQTDGVLTIVAPKVVRSQAQKITVRVT